MSQTHTFPAVRATATPWSMALCHRSAILEKQLLLKRWRKSWCHVTRSEALQVHSAVNSNKQHVTLTNRSTDCTDMVDFWTRRTSSCERDTSLAGAEWIFLIIFFLFIWNTAISVPSAPNTQCAVRPSVRSISTHLQSFVSHMSHHRCATLVFVPISDWTRLLTHRLVVQQKIHSVHQGRIAELFLFFELNRESDGQTVQ